MAILLGLCCQCLQPQRGERALGMTLRIGALLVLISGVSLSCAANATDLLVDSQDAPIAVSDQRLELTASERAYLERLAPIRVAPDPDWPPFEAINADGDFVGIAIDLLELVAERLGIAFEYVIGQDWDEAIARSQSGEVLILPFLNQTPEREQWLIFTDPLLEDPNVFITREEHPFITDLNQLEDETLALPAGTSIEERVRRDYPHLEILILPTEAEVLRAVQQREADLALRSLTVAAYTLRSEGLFNLKIAGQAPERFTNRLRMGVLKDEPQLRELLNRAIATMSARERQAIVNRHVNITVVRPFDYGFILRVAGVLVLLIGLSFYWNWRLRRVNAALRESERSKSVLIANLPGLAYRCRLDADWTMEFISDGCLELTGYSSSALLNNRDLSFNELILTEDRESIWNLWQQARASTGKATLEYRIRTASGALKWVYERGQITAGSEQETPIIEGLIIDITQRKETEQEAYRIAIHDHLTGLFNRRYLSERLEELLLQQAREGTNLSLAILDLDHFKQLNDTHGHAAGDLVLVEFATALRQIFRAYDLVGRQGGEEFLVVLAGADRAGLAAMLERLREHLRHQPLTYGDQKLRVTFSAGVVDCGEFSGAISADKLITTADARLYAAKHAGRDRTCTGEGDSRLPRTR